MKNENKNYESRCLGLNCGKMGSFSVLSEMKMMYGFLALFAKMCYDGHWPDRHRVATVVCKSNHNLETFSLEFI